MLLFSNDFENFSQKSVEYFPGNVCGYWIFTCYDVKNELPQSLVFNLNYFRRSSRYRVLQSTKANLSFLRCIKRCLAYGLLFFVTSSLVLVGIFSYLPTPTSAFMLQQHVDDLLAGKGYKPIDQRWISQAEISKHVFAAVIASEDQLFYRHYGFDVEAINKALLHNLQGGKLRGASTISQQVAKNLFLSSSKSFVRKGLEVWFTLLIEIFWSKARILEVYLNIAEFGDHLFGVEAASRRYFGIPARQLTAEQSAMLAATLPNPAEFKADQPTAYLYRRQAWILRQMRNL